MKRNERTVLWVVVATGISSVVTQLLTIREFLSQFQGNEIVIALILFNWLVLGGIGTLTAHTLTKRVHRPSAHVLARLSLALCGLAILQILAIRLLRNWIFIAGSSVGFYPTLAFGFGTMAPYCLLLGFVLPYSLFLLRGHRPDYPGTRVYIFDNIGDICGGALFSFALVFWVSPLTALFLAHLPVMVCSFFLAGPSHRNRPGFWLTLILVAAMTGGAMGIEKKPLFHFKPRISTFSLATTGCNFRCLNCQNWEISQAKPHELPHSYDLFPEAVIAAARDVEARSIAYIYSEPTTFFEYMLDIGHLARQAEIDNLWISNAYINTQPLLALCQILDAATLNIKSFDDAIYRKLNGGRQQPVLNTFKTLHRQGIHFEMINLAADKCKFCGTRIPGVWLG